MQGIFINKLQIDRKRVEALSFIKEELEYSQDMNCKIGVTNILQ